ncbi:MAG: SDR family oxidoreductase [Actinobacteria bacterium]|nr:SDR family oxidoreductase [Actinomycetota bacterium]MCB8998343.1 SDR family oxidoreductase [Actinomycetota bacterium]MCB9415468.1 SDR family oxidoreductase [Actinomycetota bacterium]HRY10494.1 SDR family oxidoreductase [Candidatus Nanopelagicales bacterium]
MTIDNDVIIVTGASSGIGLATARHLAGLGARLVLAARNADALRELAAELPGAIAIPTDVTDLDEATRLVEQTIARFGRVDVLVNNAGRAMAKPVEHIDLGEYTDLLELNVVAPLRLMQLVIPHLRAQGGGQIVNISSQASTAYIPYIAGYASTKFALNNLSLTAREELAKDDIVVSIVKPGIVDSDFGQNTPSPEPGHLRRAEDGSLLSHVIAPEAVAAAVAAIIDSGDAEINILGS